MPALSASQDLSIAKPPQIDDLEVLAAARAAREPELCAVLFEAISLGARH